MDQIDIPFPVPECALPRSYAALISAVSGLAFCIPLAPFTALIFGVIALRSKKVQVGGRSWAWAGIFLSFGGFIFLGFIVYTSYVLGPSSQRFTQSFIQDLANGRTREAISKCDAAISEEEVLQWEQRVRAIGAPFAVKCSGTLYQTIYRGGERRFNYTLDAKVSGSGGKSQIFYFGLIRTDGRFQVWNME